MNIIGIDPGKSGGIAFYDGSLTEVFVMPNSVALKRDLLKAFLVSGQIVVCYIEDVHSMPRDGVKGAFSFGYGLGELYGILSTLRVPVIAVTPQAWHKAVYGTAAKPEDWKAYAVEQATLHYPQLVENHVGKSGRKVKYPDGMAEALMILRYGLLQERNTEVQERILTGAMR